MRTRHLSDSQIQDYAFERTRAGISAVHLDSCEKCALAYQKYVELADVLRTHGAEVPEYRIPHSVYDSVINRRSSSWELVSKQSVLAALRIGLATAIVLFPLELNSIPAINILNFWQQLASLINAQALLDACGEIEQVYSANLIITFTVAAFSASVCESWYLHRRRVAG